MGRRFNKTLSRRSRGEWVIWPMEAGVSSTTVRCSARDRPEGTMAPQGQVAPDADVRFDEWRKDQRPEQGARAGCGSSSQGRQEPDLAPNSAGVCPLFILSLGQGAKSGLLGRPRLAGREIGVTRLTGRPAVLKAPLLNLS